MQAISTDMLSARTTSVNARVPFRLTSASVLLDLLRALAAIVVCLEHWRNLLFVDYGQLAAHKKAFLIPYVMTDAGHQAVIIFFVLSGYLISGTILRAWKEGQWSWKQYATHRLVRLWLVLIPALLLGGLWDRVGLFLHRSPLLYLGIVPNHMNLHVSRALDLRTLLGNVFFLQTITVPTFGSNGALWSLSNEFWYYLLFPLAICVVRRHYSTAIRCVLAALFVGIAIFVDKAILLLFPIWLLGVLLRAARPFRCGSGARLVAVFVYAVVFFTLAKIHVVNGLLSDYILGVVTYGFIWVMLSAREKAADLPSVRVIRMFANCSYTLYLVHTPLLVLFASLFVGDVRRQPTPANIALALVGLMGTLLFALLVAFGTEFRTEQIRGWFEGKIGVSRGTRRALTDAEVVPAATS